MKKGLIRILNIIILIVTFISLTGINITSFRCAHSKHSHINISFFDFSECKKDEHKNCASHNHNRKENCSNICHAAQKSDLYKIIDPTKTENNKSIIYYIALYFDAYLLPRIENKYKTLIKHKDRVLESQDRLHLLCTYIC